MKFKVGDRILASYTNGHKGRPAVVLEIQGDWERGNWVESSHYVIEYEGPNTTGWPNGNRLCVCASDLEPHSEILH